MRSVCLFLLYWVLCTSVCMAVDPCLDCPEPRRTADSDDIDVIPLAKMDISGMTCGSGKAQKGRANEGKPLVIGGETYACGVGTHAPSRYELAVDGGALSFAAHVGVDHETGAEGSVEFIIYGDGKVLARTGVMHRKDGARPIYADLAGIKIVELAVTDGGDGINCDHADWCNAVFRFKKGCKPGDLKKYTTQHGVLTPPEGKAPRINTPAVYGVRPGHDIVFRVPVTGERPMKISVSGLETLPGKSLGFDPDRQILSGSIPKRGEWKLTVVAENAYGKAEKPFAFVVGDKLALTPPMGWNSWNHVADNVSDAIVRRQAEAMVARGLADHGYQFVNIDDFWQRNNGRRGKGRPELNGPERAADGTILPNARFPDMKALADHVHGLGLKIGLYSSPGPHTCGGCTGSYGFEEQDAKTWANWGFDYVKYDWCSYGGVTFDGSGVEKMKHPYRLMGDILKKVDRDIVFSICQYGMGDVWKWGENVGGNCWRTTGDVWDSWNVVAPAIGRQARIGRYSAPGAWNDPDMLVVKPTLKQTRLTPNEQYSHISMWAMVASPLMIGCDMAALDEFTYSLLTNDEVIEIDQDPLGRGAELAGTTGVVEVWTRPLAGGGWALALFNPSAVDQEVECDLAAFGLPVGRAPRDVWRQTALPVPDGGKLKATVYGHATNLYRF